jgi:hypothetical protein
VKRFKYIALGLLALAALVLVWGVVIEPYLIDVQAYTVAIPDLTCRVGGPGGRRGG